jgi:hypothetical protein
MDLSSGWFTMDQPWGRTERSLAQRLASDAGLGDSPRGILEEKGAEGNLTIVGGGRHGDGARPAMSFNSGSDFLLTMR